MGKKAVMVILIVVVMLGGLGAGVYLVQQSQDLEKKAAPASTLDMSLVGLSPSVNDNFVVASNINTAENMVIAVELHINFDPTKVEFVQANPGSFFTSPQTIGPTVNNSAGTIVYSLYLSPQSSPQQGQGVVATFTFKARAAGSTTIAYSPQTIVGAVGESGQNVLIGTTPLNVSIAAVASSPTPSPVPVEEDNEGIGGIERELLAQNQLTPTVALSPTSTVFATLSPTIMSTASATVTPTFAEATLPDSGLTLPTMIMAGAGLLIFIFAFALF